MTVVIDQQRLFWASHSTTVPRVEFFGDDFAIWSTAEGQLLVWPRCDQPADFIALLAVPEMLCGHC